DPPAGGPGTKVILRGAGIDASPLDETSVSIGTARAEVTARGAGWLASIVPAGALGGPVQVTNARGTAISKAAFVVVPSVKLTLDGGLALRPLESRRCEVVPTGLGDPAVLWHVNGIQGGSAELGTIDKSGTYTAPAVPPVD